MQIIDYFSSADKTQWLCEIKKSDWCAGQYLCELLQKGELKKLCGSGAKVLLLTQGDELVSFCTYAEQDEIAEPSLAPWIGFVYTFPAHRGKRLAGKLIERACALAKDKGHEFIYVSTDAAGLYENYGFTFWKNMKNIRGEDCRVYRRNLACSSEIK